MKGHVENYLRTLIIHSYFKVNDFSNSNLTDRLEYLDKPLFLWCGTLPVAEIYNSESSAFRNWWAAEILTHCHHHKEVDISLKITPKVNMGSFYVLPTFHFRTWPRSPRVSQHCMRANILLCSPVNLRFVLEVINVTRYLKSMMREGDEEDVRCLDVVLDYATRGC